MSQFEIHNPFDFFAGLDGRGLNEGEVFIGVAGQDPETDPQAVYWDEAGAIPATQPLSVLGGYIMRLGSPSRAYTAATYSMRVRDRNGVQVFYETETSVPGEIGVWEDITSVTVPSSVNRFYTAGYSTPGVGGAFYVIDPDQVTATSSRTRRKTANNRWFKLDTQYGANVLATGALGGADDTDAFQAALDVSPTVIVPQGTFITRGLTAEIANQAIIGSGSGCVISFKGGETGYHFDCNDHLVNISNVRWFGGDDSGKTGVPTEPTPGSATDRSGLLVNMDDDTTLNGVFVHGYGNRAVAPKNAASARHSGFIINGGHFYNCWMGVELLDVSEYVRLSAPAINGCRIGLWIGAGNVTGTGAGICSDNGYNVFLSGTGNANNAHGSISGWLLNHATLFAIWAEDVTNGFLFNLNNIFYGSVALVNCDGVLIDDGIFDVDSFQFDGGGYNRVRGNFCPNTLTNLTTYLSGARDTTEFSKNVTAAGVFIANNYIDKLGQAAFVSGDRPLASWGENGAMETDGWIWTTNGGTGEMKLFKKAAGTVSPTPTLVFNRVSGLTTQILAGLTSAVDDAAAAAAGVPLNGLYQNAGAVRERLV